MGLLTKLFLGGDNVAEPIKAIGNTFDQLFTSDEERAQAALLLEQLKQKPHILQAELSKIEASHKSIFVAGWRPALGWVCAMGLFFVFVLNPIIQWLTCNFAEQCIKGPEMPLESMMTLVVSLLGLGGLRTYEKVKGISK